MSSRVSRYGRAPQVERQRALREPAEPALEGAHVGVVDVAVADPRDGVADGAGDRSSSASSATAATSRPRAENRVTSSSRPGSWPSRTPLEHLAHRARRPGAFPAGWRGGCTSAPEYHWVERRPDQHHLGAVADVLVLADLLRDTPRPGRPAPALRRRCGPSPRSACPRRAIAPGRATNVGVDGEPGRQLEARGPR